MTRPEIDALQYTKADLLLQACIHAMAMHPGSAALTLQHSLLRKLMCEFPGHDRQALAFAFEAMAAQIRTWPSTPPKDLDSFPTDFSQAADKMTAAFNEWLLSGDGK